MGVCSGLTPAASQSPNAHRTAGSWPARPLNWRRAGPLQGASNQVFVVVTAWTGVDIVAAWVAIAVIRTWDSAARSGVARLATRLLVAGGRI